MMGQHGISKGYTKSCLVIFHRFIYMWRGFVVVRITNALTNNRAACHLEFIQPVKVEIRCHPDRLWAALSKSGKQHGWITLARGSLFWRTTAACLFTEEVTPHCSSLRPSIKWYTGRDAEQPDIYHVTVIPCGAAALIQIEKLETAKT